MFDLKECVKSEFPKTAAVACQGAEGAYSQLAASSLFEKPDIMYMRSFDGVFRAVNTGLCKYGVLPVENSNAGSVTDVYDLMKTHNFYIVRSIKVSISHMLLANEKIGVESIKQVYTHEQAARQCSNFLERNPHIKVNYCANTAVAARFVAESGQKDIAAIASGNCASRYNLTVASKNIQNSKNNYTRFICISKECEIYDNSDKVSLMLTVQHKAGALYDVIRHFANLKLNLTKLESRPIADTDFEFMFYFDVQANIKNEDINTLLAKLSQCTNRLVFLGNYSELSIDLSDLTTIYK